MSNHGVVAYADTLHHAYMKMETVEHFAKVALVTHLLGQQQPLEGQDLEKLLLARSKYEGSHSAAPLPLATADGPGNHNGPQRGSADPGLRDSPRSPARGFRNRARVKA